MPQHFKIVAYNDRDEPFNSEDLYQTPQYVNTGEYVRFSYASTTGLTFKGDEYWIWDFDYSKPDNEKDNIVQTIKGLNTPIPALFYRGGEREVNVKVRESIPKKSIKLQSFSEITTLAEPTKSIYNPLTNTLLVINHSAHKVTFIDVSSDTIIKTINLSGNPRNIVFCQPHNRFYIVNDNLKIDTIDATTNTYGSLITLNGTGTVGEMVYVQSTDSLYVIENDSPNSVMEIVDCSTNTIPLSPITIPSNSKSLKLFNGFLWFVNEDDDTISKFDVSDNSIISINTSPSPKTIETDSIKIRLYIRCADTVDVCNLNVITDTIPVESVVYNSDIILNETLQEIYVVGGTNSLVQTIDSNDYILLEKSIEVRDIKSLFMDTITNSLIVNQTVQIGNTTKKRTRILDSSDFTEQTFFTTTGDTFSYYRTPSGKIYGAETNSSKVSSFSLYATNTSTTVKGKILYQDTSSFNVFEFPKTILGLEYATEGESLTYSTDSGTNSAQSYEWFINGIKQTSVINELTFAFTNYVKAKVEANVINGLQHKKLSFLTALSVGSSVIGKHYDGNVKDNLMFFNKEGDHLNFEMVDDGMGNMYWQGDMMFHANSDDTFKTIGLYTLEQVDPIRYTSENIILRKLQLFNENGFDVEGGDTNGTSFYIEKIEQVNRQEGFYTKWLYSIGIDKKIPIGTELLLKNFYNTTIDDSIPETPILTAYSKIEELDSYSTSGGIDLFTVVGNKRDAIMVITKTPNTTFTSSYNYGDFRLQNNNIKNIPQGSVSIYNVFKIYDSETLNAEWNEPFYDSLLYDKKKISLINSQKNDGIYTTNFIDDDISNKLNRKYLKINKIKNIDLVPQAKYDFSLNIKFNTNKIRLGNSPVDFLPAATDLFLNTRSLLVWESLLNKDYTPAILKDGLKFSFEQVSPTVSNFDKIYTAIKVDTAKNILTPQTTDYQGIKIKLRDYAKLEKLALEFTINDISSYTATEGTEWKRGNSLSDAAKNLAIYLDEESNKVKGLSVIAIGDEVWVWQKTGYTFFIGGSKINAYSVEQGILKTNHPDYGIVGDNWVLLDDESFNGYVHQRVFQNNFYVLYVIGTGDDKVKNWYTLPINKKVVWTEQYDRNDPSSEPGMIIDYAENLISENYLEENSVSLIGKGDTSPDALPDMVIERFLADNKNILLGYGVDSYMEDDFVCLSNTLSTKTILTIDDYITVSFQPQYEAIYGSSGTSGASKFIDSSTSALVDYLTIDMFNVLEAVKPEKNRIIGNFIKTKSISSIWGRKIIIKDIDQKVGLTFTINGIDYQVPYNAVSSIGLSPEDDTVLSIEATLENFGNQLFKISQDINTVVDDADVGKPYHEVLESQGILIWLEKSGESTVNNIKHFDTLVIQSRFPNVSITYDINGTLDDHKILHSEVEFMEMGTVFTVTINRTPYSIPNAGGIFSTLESWVSEYGDTLLSYGIVTNTIDSTFGTNGTGGSVTLTQPILRFGTLHEKTVFNYTIWIGKTPVLGKDSYIRTDFKIGNQGIILSGNEVRASNVDFQAIGFSTAMILSLKNSVFPLNNQEYNIIFDDPSVLGLSYQGAFWNNTDTLTRGKERSGFNWDDYIEIESLNPTNGIFSTAGISSINDISNATYIEYDSFNDYIWVAHNDGLNATISIYDPEDFSTKGYVEVNNNPTYMKWNPLDTYMYVSCKGSMKVLVIDTENFSIIRTIPMGISPTQMVIDDYTNYMYVLNEDTDEIIVSDLSDGSVLMSIPVGDKPVKMSLDRVNRLLYVACQAVDKVYIIDTKDNVLKSYISVGSHPSDVIWNSKTSKMYISNSSSGTVSTILWNSGSDTFSVGNITVDSNPTSFEYVRETNTIYLVCNDKIDVINGVDDTLNVINVGYQTGILKFIPFARSIFFTLPNDNKVGLFDVSDEFYNLTILPVGNTPVNINWSTNNLIFVANQGSDYLSVLRETSQDDSGSSGTSGILDLVLSTRQFLRYPRERYDSSDPIYFKVSWEDVDESMFFYDFSGKQLYLEMKNKKGDLKRINDYGVFNYQGSVPLITEGVSYLNKNYNKNLELVKDKKSQQTIFDNLYFDLDFIDSETDLDPRPFPIQIFCGYNSKKEGTNNRTLKIERLENISTTVTTRQKDDTDPSKGFIDILNFNGDTNEIKAENSTINFIDLGFKIDQIIQISGKDTLNTKNEATFQNSGLIAKIVKVYVNRLVVLPVNKPMVTESTFTKTYSLLSPFRAKNAAIKVFIEVLPETIAKITLKGQTEIEDERFNVLLSNFGHNINHRDIFIFKEYDIVESGIDWIYLNQKRKEMMTNYSEIYNYLGSYKALINAVNYFGYQDLEVYEYYLNIDKNSLHYNKLHKIEIPDIFDSSVKGYTPNDFIIQSLPNNRYQKTKLFNLTYRITDTEGNYILGYSLDEVITKLLGLKKWLRENIMPIGTRILDLTGRGDTPAETTVWHDVKQLRKFSINENFTPVDFKAEAYLQPVENNSKLYNVHLEFFTQGTNFLPDTFQVDITTYSTVPDFTVPNFKMRSVQRMSYYKTDFKSLNFAADRYIDPFVLIEVTSGNNYASNYSIQKTFSLELLAFIQ